MRRTRLVFGMTALFLTTGVVVTVAQGRSGAPKPPHTTAPHTVTTVKPGSAVTPKAMKPASAPKAPKPAATKVRPASVAKPPTAKKPAPAVKTLKTTKAATGSPAKSAKPAKSAPATRATAEKPKPVKTEKTAKVAATTPVTLTPVQEKLQKNSNLAAKLTSRLPDGTNLMTASAGFKNLGQFVAAVNVSNNLGIPFAQLKTKMVTDGKSLGQAIQILKPASSATIEAQHAEYDARGMIVDSEQQPQVTTVAVTAAKTKAKPRKTAQ